MRKFFYPESIAIIGASRDQKKVGNRIVNNLLTSKYGGKIYPVNPEAHEILGLKCYRDIGDIPSDIDLVLVAVPAEKVEASLDKCLVKKLGGVVVVSAGFSEIGELELEHQLSKKAETCDFRIIGPNTFGIINTKHAMNASFAYGMPPKGDISFVTQSGAMAEALIMWMKEENVGISKIVGTGNKMDVDDADLIEYLGRDKDTKVIAMYIESVKDGRRFIEAARDVSKKKPLVALKGGKGVAGVRAAGSHTGAITSQYNLYEAAFKQGGIISADDTTELLDMALALCYQKPAVGKRVGIVTNGGGSGVVFSDLIERFGAVVPILSERDQKRLMKFLPGIASPRNPVDILGDGEYERYKTTIGILLEADLDLIVSLHVETTLVEPMEVARGILDASKSADIPLVSAWIGGERIKGPMRMLLENCIPSYPDLRRAASTVKALIHRGKLLYG
jgi:acetyl coenzyme A synthetase (ADP forming)-like protein